MYRQRRIAWWRCLAINCLFSVPAGATEALQKADEFAALPDINRLRHERPATAATFVLVQPVLNGVALDASIFVGKRGRDVMLPSAFLAENNIQHTGAREWLNGQAFAVASDLSSMQVTLLEDKGAVDIDCTAGCFETTELSVQRRKVVEPSQIAPGAFINYDLFAQIGNDKDTFGGLAEFGLFSNAGTLLANAACSNSSSAPSCLRLETSWTIDNPKSAHRLRFGDAITSAAGWSAPARFGGIRWGTDYSLRPDFVTFPTPSFSGEAALPGSVELLFNNAQRFESGLPAGPFSVSDLPVVTGAGTAQIVVTDMLGRETVISADYYTAPQLLKPGLAEYALETGFLRQDFGTRSNAYGSAFASGTYVRGITSGFTAGIRAELSADHQTGGITTGFANKALGVVETAAAVSNVRGQTGTLVDIRHEWRSSSFSIGSGISVASRHFTRFGQERVAPRITARSFVSYNDPGLGGASLSWTYRNEQSGDKFHSAGFRYAKSFKSISVNVSALHIYKPASNFVAALSLSIPLGSRTTASVGTEYDGNHMGGDVRYRRSAAAVGELGYDARIAIDGVDRYEAGAEYQTHYGDASARFSKVNAREAGRFTVRGGLGFLAGKPFMAPPITNSFAVVSVGKEAGVHVYHDRQMVGTTDSDGKVVIPRLRAFERNTISFEAEDLGLATSFDAVDTVITPGLRTGHRIAFKVKQSVNLMANIVMQDGAPLGPGHQLTDLASGKTIPIGRNGRIYIADAQPRMRLRYDRGGKRCDVTLDVPKASGDAPYHLLGEIPCINRFEDRI